ncbi:MAG: zf-HC2 domain-containing protein [Vicinamibacterales bacterium]
MNDSPYCGNPDVLMSYLYEESPAEERLAFEAHLRQCERCAAEAAALRAVRVDMAGWTPPETVLDFRIVREPAPAKSRWGWMSTMPAWAQLAAASLVIGVAAGLSGLDVQYGKDGLIVRTGWSRPADTRPAGARPEASAASADAPWHADLAALQEQMRSEFSQAAPAPSAVPVSAAVAGGGKAMSDGEFMARVKQLIEASETRTQREMALRMTEMVRDMDTQRRADMRRVADGLGVLEGRTGAVTAQQREVMNYLMRVSQRQQ